MMMPAFRLRDLVLGVCLVGMLSGCAVKPERQAQPSPAMDTITMTPSEVAHVKQAAYDEGFEAGRRYERKHPQPQPASAAAQPDQPDQSDQAADLTASLPPAPAPAEDQAQAQPPPPSSVTCPPTQTAPTLAPIPPLPPTAGYTSSGPAKPLSP